MKIGYKLKELRLEKGIKQKEAAEILGISPKTLSHWESDTNEPNLTMLKALAKLYGINVSELFGEDVIDAESKNSMIEDIIDMLVAKGKFTANDFDLLDSGSQQMLIGAVNQYAEEIKKKNAKQ